MEKVILISCFFVLLSCVQTHSQQEAVVFEVSEVAKEQQIPRDIMDQIEKEVQSDVQRGGWSDRERRNSFYSIEKEQLFFSL